MSLILLYSDLHLRPERLADCETVLDEILRLALEIREKKKQEVLLMNGGDTFNTRGILQTSCFDRLCEHYLRWSAEGFSQIINIGNHDQEDKAGKVHPMRAFDELKGWRVIDKATHLPELDFSVYPYIHGLENIQSAIAALPRSKYALVHWGIKGAHRNSGNVDATGVPIEWLKGYRKVFSGHYHLRSVHGNVQYIGSPMQQNFGEMGQEKGVTLFDTATEKATFYPLINPPKHYEIQVHLDTKKEEILAPEGIREKDFTRVRVYGEAERCATVTPEWIAKRAKVGHSVKIERFSSDVAVSRLSVGVEEIHTPLALMEKYVDFVDTTLDKKRLLQIGKELAFEF